MEQEHNFCTNCGAPLTPGAKFCTKCGTPVEGVAAQPAQSMQSQAEPTQPKVASQSVQSTETISETQAATAVSRKKRWPWAIVGVVILLLVAAGGFWFTHRTPSVEQALDGHVVEFQIQEQKKWRNLFDGDVTAYFTKINGKMTGVAVAKSDLFPDGGNISDAEYVSAAKTYFGKVVKQLKAGKKSFTVNGIKTTADDLTLLSGSGSEWKMGMFKDKKAVATLRGLKVVNQGASINGKFLYEADGVALGYQFRIMRKD